VDNSIGGGESITIVASA